MAVFTLIVWILALLFVLAALFVVVLWFLLVSDRFHDMLAHALSEASQDLTDEDSDEV